MDIVDRLRVPGVDHRDPVGVTQLASAARSAADEIERLRAALAAADYAADRLLAAHRGKVVRDLDEAIVAWGNSRRQMDNTKQEISDANEK